MTKYSGFVFAWWFFLTSQHSSIQGKFIGPFDDRQKCESFRFFWTAPQSVAIACWNDNHLEQ